MSVMARARQPRLASPRQERLAEQWGEIVERATAPLPVDLPPRLERALIEFRWRDARGMTADEARHELGDHWRERIQELQRLGFTFAEHRSKYAPHKTFRWVLETEPLPESTEDFGF